MSAVHQGRHRLSRRRRTVLAGLGALVAVFAAAPVAQAHHGWSQYGSDDFSLTGVVEAVDLGNPHGELKVSADGQVWDVVLGPPGRNRRAGLDEEAVAVGDTVTAYGRRHRDEGRLEMKTERLEVGDRVYDIYPERL